MLHRSQANGRIDQVEYYKWYFDYNNHHMSILVHIEHSTNMSTMDINILMMINHRQGRVDYYTMD